MNCKKTYHQAQNIQSALFLQRERSTYSTKLRKIGKVYKKKHVYVYSPERRVELPVIPGKTKLSKVVF